MESYFENAIQRAKDFAHARSTQELSTEEYYNEVHSNIKLSPPYFDKENIRVTLGEEVMTFANVPDGVSFTPGDKMEYASFGIPIKGDINVFQEKFKHMLANNGKTIRLINSVLYIKEFSQVPLQGNDNAIEKVKNIVRAKVNHIDDTLNTLKEEIDGFNNSTLKAEIRDAAKKELEKRNLKEDTINKLNLF